MRKSYDFSKSKRNPYMKVKKRYVLGEGYINLGKSFCGLIGTDGYDVDLNQEALSPRCKYRLILERIGDGEGK